jgi:hypothetical protein
MADHTTGIYQYTSVNIPTNVTVTFIPNANNTPVTWLIQGSCVIAGIVDLSGQSPTDNMGAIGGPGGWRGGNGSNLGGSGQGPGGGATGHNGSFGSLGQDNTGTTNGIGPIYGNQYLLPLLGGSGGGNYINGYNQNLPGGGGGGAILIAAPNQIQITGTLQSLGGGGEYGFVSCSSAWGGGGSGGAIRLVCSQLVGNGRINVSGGMGIGWQTCGGWQVYFGSGGAGRIRLDVLDNSFGGTISGIASSGFQPVLNSGTGATAQLVVSSVGGVPISSSPSGILAIPDAILSAQQNNPIPVVVNCANLPLNSQITVSVKPMNGSAVSATGYNNTGTLASSTATVSIVIPRGGGLIYATAATSN